MHLVTHVGRLEEALVVHNFDGGPLAMGPRAARPDRRVDIVLLLGATSIAAIAYVAAVVLEIGPPHALAVAFLAAPPLCAAFSVWGLESRARADGDIRLAWVSAGLTVAVAAMALQFVGYRIVAPDGGIFGTSGQSSAALYLLFHVALIAGAAAGVLQVGDRWRLPSVVVGVVLALLLATNTIPLPLLFHRGGTRFTPLLIGLEVTLALAASAVTALWVWRVGRTAAVLQAWVGAALLLTACDVALNAVGGQRFTEVWWASLSLRVATYLVLAFGVLSSVLRRLRDMEAYAEAELDRREGQLRGSLTATAGLLASAEQLSRAISPAEVADVLSANARALVGARFASVALDGESGLRLLGADGYTGEDLRRLGDVDWTQVFGHPQVLRAGEPLFLADRDDLRRRLSASRDLPVGAAAAMALVPIRVQRHPIGVLTVWDPAPRSWSEHQRRVLTGLVAQGGQALARARAYEEQADAARILQTSLLPARLPQPQCLRLAGLYQPAVDGTLVGGDWYDCLALEDGRVALVVGDVMGKGLQAAAQMGQIRTAVRSLAAVDPRPAAVLSALDELDVDLDQDGLVTLVYLLVDPNRGALHVGRAGHLPPVLLRSNGEAEFVEAGGSAPLGAPGQTRYEAELPLCDEALLVLYTDGLVEDRSSGLDGGMQRLTEYLQQADVVHRAADALAVELLAACTAGAAQDDVAILVAKYIPLPTSPAGSTTERDVRAGRRTPS